jgi:hypothetical protein
MATVPVATPAAVVIGAHPDIAQKPAKLWLTWIVHFSKMSISCGLALDFVHDVET